MRRGWLILREEFHDATNDRRILFGVYNMNSQSDRVPLGAPTSSDVDPCLMHAPANLDEFRVFAAQVATSRAISYLLG